MVELLNQGFFVVTRVCQLARKKEGGMAEELRMELLTLRVELAVLQGVLVQFPVSELGGNKQ